MTDHRTKMVLDGTIKPPRWAVFVVQHFNAETKKLEPLTYADCQGQLWWFGPCRDYDFDDAVGDTRLVTKARKALKAYGFASLSEYSLYCRDHIPTGISMRDADTMSATAYYQSIEEANAAAKNAKEGKGIKSAHVGIVQPEIAEVAGMAREYRRMRYNDRSDDRTVPWRRENWYSHFAYVSKTDQSKIAFTADDKDLMLDKQTVTRPGRYLARFFKDTLSNDEIERWTQKWTHDLVNFEVAVTQDEHECAQIYIDGPNSCMSGDIFAKDCHPARVYGGPDLGVAYARRGDGKITARAVVWPDKKIASTIYGNKAALWPALKKMGYTEYDRDMLGARVQKIYSTEHGKHLMPYIDGVCGIDESECGNYFEITELGHWSAEETCGFLEGGAICDHCGEYCDPDYGTFTDDGLICEGCLDNHYIYCDYYGEYRECNDPVCMQNGEVWSRRAFELYGGVCDHCGESCADLEHIEGAGEAWCEGCASDEASDCTECWEKFPTEMLNEDNNTCPDCASTVCKETPDLFGT